MSVHATVRFKHYLVAQPVATRALSRRIEERINNAVHCVRINDVVLRVRVDGVAEHDRRTNSCVRARFVERDRDNRWYAQRSRQLSLCATIIAGNWLFGRDSTICMSAVGIISGLEAERSCHSPAMCICIASMRACTERYMVPAASSVRKSGATLVVSDRTCSSSDADGRSAASADCPASSDGRSASFDERLTSDDNRSASFDNSPVSSSDRAAVHRARTSQSSAQLLAASSSASQTPSPHSAENAGSDSDVPINAVGLRLTAAAVGTVAAGTPDTVWINAAVV